MQREMLQPLSLRKYSSDVMLDIMSRKNKTKLQFEFVPFTPFVSMGLLDSLLRFNCPPAAYNHGFMEGESRC